MSKFDAPHSEGGTDVNDIDTSTSLARQSTTSGKWTGHCRID